MPESQNNRRRDNWHLEKSVSFSHIISTVALLCGGVAAVVALNSRIAILETQQLEINARMVQILEQQVRVDARQDSEIVRIGDQRREDYRDLSRRLESLTRRDTGL